MGDILYKVHDTIADEMVGYFDSREKVLFGIYEFLKYKMEASSVNDDWVEFFGKIGDFIISEVEINEFIKDGDENRVYIIDSKRYEKFMLYGPREHNIDKILNDEI